LMLLGFVSTLSFFMNPGKDTRVRFLSTMITSTTILVIGVFARLPRVDTLSRLSGFVIYTFLHIVTIMIVNLLLKSAYLSAGGWIFEKNKDYSELEKRLKLNQDIIEKIQVKEGGQLHMGPNDINMDSKQSDDAAEMIKKVTQMEELNVQIGKQEQEHKMNFIQLLFKIFFTRTRLSTVPLFQKKTAVRFVVRLNDFFRFAFPVFYIAISLFIMYG